MKKFLTLLAFAGLIGTVNAQTTETTPDKDKAAKVEKSSSCAGKAEAKDGKSCCAGKAGAKADATGAIDAPATEAKAAGCCAGKASASGKSCHGGDAKAEAVHGHGDGHGHGHGEGHGDAKDHSCSAACKDGAHVTACGEKGHACSEACHAKKM
jgi:hypothetical protein